MNSRKAETLEMVEIALFVAIILIMAFTPFLGYIPLGFMKATIVHVPVIIGSILLGPKKGALLGGVFGLTSFVNNSFINPTITSFVITPIYTLGEMKGGVGSIIICFVPRILVGVIPYYIYRVLRKSFKNKQAGMVVSLGAAGVIGSLTNTLLVMNLIYLFFGDSFLMVNDAATKGYLFILSIIGMNGVPEAIVSAILVSFVGRVLLKIRGAVN